MPSFSVLPGLKALLFSAPALVSNQSTAPLVRGANGNQPMQIRIQNVLATLVVALSVLPLAAEEAATGSTTNQTESLPEVVVFGTRIPAQPENTASPVTVIAREEILGTQQRFVADVLRDTTGVDVVRSGQPGGNTSMLQVVVIGLLPGGVEGHAMYLPIIGR